ncbi:hypothetical protein EMIHUDRAFT_451662 [Emiliania huxleyi CCMP1516]|uniref:tRNA (guanine(10)-N(2))-methyltransferase TRMT11 N-terminal domain-containing protein n=2 Tax=Emiliania huxleyi TaxID=2903 RepID=A0A0D3IWM9_EMIH1|nr:hypothetical protein EMIHUDRAFT_451662 [Emiliania huxleyi CCMP1516]EOD15664.1 hypothetical protein EMIHUDRAFT_451662 [Emiliania huxleyi CCMP1516]|eukprot:XP_005768093.1 hypothetical protein EMIHUDRAFT_451662 [Emiliania huxleyi CCMP1516]
MSAMPPSIDTRALEPPTSATTVATTVASSVSHLCHFVHEWLDFRVPELLAAAEAVGVDVSATDADIDELSAGAGGVYLPVSCSSGSAGLARVAARAVLVKRFVEVWASGASIAELEGRLRACPAEVYAPYLREGSSFKVVVDGYGGSASEPDRLELITRLAKLLSPRGKVRLKSPDYTLVLLVDFAILADLFSLATASLVPGGRLVFLLPCTLPLAESLALLPPHPTLEVVGACEQRMAARWSRWCVTMIRSADGSAEATTSGAEPSPAGEEAAVPDLRRTIFERRCGGGGAAADRPVAPVLHPELQEKVARRRAGYSRNGPPAPEACAQNGG